MPDTTTIPDVADPTALRPEDLARMLQVDEPAIRAHLDAGAPTDPDGTLNLAHYVAWLVARTG